MIDRAPQDPGWRYLRVNGRLMDLCPSCIQKVAA